MMPQELIQRITESNNIIDVISEHVKLDKRGVNYIGCCPFHSEKTASFTVSPAKQIFKCFGCGKSGNVVKFVEGIEGVSWIEAIKLLADKAKIELPRRDISPEEKEALDIRERLYIVNQFAAATWQSNFEASPGRTYMLERGFDDDDFSAFGLGYAPESWDYLLNAATKASHRPETLLEAGLIGRSENQKLYDRFRDRVIWPIQTVTGKLAGFTGRIILPDPEKKQSKYMNSPETAVFHKSELLFGLYQAKNAIVKEGRCNLVEGNTDVMRWHKCGVKNTVASCGTALTAQHFKLIHRFTNNLTIVMDGDPAGIKAAIKGIDLAVAEGLTVYIALMPTGEDPDSFARGKSQQELSAWIEANETDFILFRVSLAAKEMDEKPAEKARILNEIKATIGLITDETTREIYLNKIAAAFDIDAKKLAKSIPLDRGDVFALDANADRIKKEDEVFICTKKEDCMAAITREEANCIAIPGHPMKPEWYSAIEVLTKNLVFMDPINEKFEKGKEPANIKDYIKLGERGFRVMVTPPETWSYETDHISFTEIYFKLLYENCDQYDTESKKIAIEKSAEFLARQDKTTISIKTGEVAKLFGITKAAFEQVLKPFVNLQKSKKGLATEAIMIDDKMWHIDSIDNLPEWVDKNFLNKFNHFPVQNSKGTKIFYMFRDDNGKLFRVANFYMEPQFHVTHDDDAKNKRIIKFNHAENNSSRYVEVPSATLAEYGQFKKFLYKLGQYSFRNGKPQHLDMIYDSIVLDFPEVEELEIFGRQEEGFYAFSNAIYYNGKVERMNELGLISHNGRTYYSPSVSCIYKDIRKDNDRYAQDRFFIYRETHNINLTDWAELFLKVYKYNNNGHWSVLLTLMTAFRSDIYAIDRLFTTLFLIGPTGCGKSELAQSIRAVYMHHTAPMFNLNSGTDAAFFTTLERFRDAPVIMEEYNDMTISDAKFQGLKAAVYDGEGKTKRKDASSKDLDTSKVNAVPILLGQESPQRDDGSLGNRCVILEIKKVEFWSDDETANFQRLKKLEKDGLSNILIEILNQTETVHNKYTKKLRKVQKEFRDDFKASGEYFDTRVLNTISLFTAMALLIEEEVTAFKLPFSYADFYTIARKKLIDQSGSIQKTNRLSVFFDTLLLLSEDTGPRKIINGRDFKIETHDVITVGRGKDETIKTFDGQPTKLLFLRLDMIHPKYKAQVGDKEHLKMNNLMTYIKDHPSYVGQIKTTQFNWKVEERMDDGTGKVVSVMRSFSTRTSATVLNYDMLRDDVIDLGDGTAFEIAPSKKDKGNQAPTEERDEALAQAKADTPSEDLPF